MPFIIGGYALNTSQQGYGMTFHIVCHQKIHHNDFQEFSLISASSSSRSSSLS